MGLVYHEKEKYYFSFSWYKSILARSQEVAVRMIEEIMTPLTNELLSG